MAARKKRGRVGGMRPGAGRKPKSPEEKQSRALMLHLTEAEYAALQEAAAEEPIATVARRLVLRALALKKGSA